MHSLMDPNKMGIALVTGVGMQGANYRAKARGKKLEGEVALVLGAGNQTPVACMDILHKLFVDDAVVVCKMNPVNEYLGKYIRCCPVAWCIFAGCCALCPMPANHFCKSHTRMKVGHGMQVGVCSPGSSRVRGDCVWGCQGGCLSDQLPSCQVHPPDRLLRNLRCCRLGRTEEGMLHCSQTPYSHISRQTSKLCGSLLASWRCLSALSVAPTSPELAAPKLSDVSRYARKQSGTNSPTPEHVHTGLLRQDAIR